jgi:hypothetical protein
MNEDLNVQQVLHQKCFDFGYCYDTDVDWEELCTEMCDFKMQLDANIETLPLSLLDLLFFTVSFSDGVFRYLRIVLQILLSISVSIAICQRSFSNLILSYLRSSI